jgi:hypothetical protein
LRRFVLDLHVLDARATRSSAERALHTGHGLDVSVGQRLDATVRAIPDPAGDAFPLRDVRRKLAKAHALNTTADREPSRDAHAGQEDAIGQRMKVNFVWAEVPALNGQSTEPLLGRAVACTRT